MPEPLAKIVSILGTDNTSETFYQQIRSNAGLFVREALNIDIDDEGKPHRRNGHGASATLSGTDIHSWWSNGEIGLFVDGTNFKKVDKDFTATTLITGLVPGDRVNYVSVNKDIYFGSNSMVGYIRDGLSYAFPDPDQTHKIRMVGGHILEFYNSRLYAANDSNLFYSDATVLTRMDKRKNAIAFPGRMTMLKAVADGLYVSCTDKAAGDKTFFLKGGDPYEFLMIEILDEAAYEGSAITIDGDDIGRGASGKTIRFLTPSGPYKGYPNGILVEQQGGLFGIDDDVEVASSILKTDNGYQQYLAIYELQAGVGGASIDMKMPNLTTESLE